MILKDKKAKTYKPPEYKLIRPFEDMIKKRLKLNIEEDILKDIRRKFWHKLHC